MHSHYCEVGNIAENFLIIYIFRLITTFYILLYIAVTSVYTLLKNELG